MPEGMRAPKYRIRTTYKADTRQKLQKMPSESELFDDTRTHIKDVHGLGKYWVRMKFLPEIGSHDWTKLKFFMEFYDNFNSTINEKRKFKEHSWWLRHVSEEPHHAFDYKGSTPLQLVHILHMCFDWVCAGKARDTNAHIEIKQTEEEIKELLYRAFMNTLKWLDDNTTT